MKLKEKAFHQLWCQYTKECKTKDDLRQALGLTDIHPLDTRRDRMTAKGHVFPLLSQSAPVPATDTHSLLILKDHVRTLRFELKAAQREQVDATYIKEKVLKLTSQPSSPPWMAGREV